MLRLILMVMIIVTMLYPSDWRWADDTAEFEMDKQAHFGVSFGLYYSFFTYTNNIILSLLFSISFNPP